MHEIICPNCNKAFKIDETGYADILKQVRDKEFEKQLNARLELAEKEKLTAVELEKTKAAGELDKSVALKDAKIQELNGKLETSEMTKKLAVNEAINAIEKERDSLKNGLELAKFEKELGEKALKDKYETQIKDRDDTIERLRDMKVRLSTKMVGETLEQQMTHLSHL